MSDDSDNVVPQRDIGFCRDFFFSFFLRLDNLLAEEFCNYLLVLSICQRFGEHWICPEMRRSRNHIWLMGFSSRVKKWELTEKMFEFSNLGSIFKVSICRLFVIYQSEVKSFYLRNLWKVAFLIFTSKNWNCTATKRDNLKDISQSFIAICTVILVILEL